MAKIGLPTGSGKLLKVWEKSVKSQGILKWILSGNPVKGMSQAMRLNNTYHTVEQQSIDVDQDSY